MNENSREEGYKKSFLELSQAPKLGNKIKSSPKYRKFGEISGGMTDKEILRI